MIGCPEPKDPWTEEAPTCKQPKCRRLGMTLKEEFCGCWVCPACSDGEPCRGHSFDAACEERSDAVREAV
jgi:hypothetical protein